ncbi:lysoplasmalogenase [Flavobacterium aquidurense]|uniref:lysoplasmalogenase n=1 Tax=Flavobacterium aquidurense TaxID=362413 RepID=UPI00285A2C0D|nr:lysoplasmalogenase [Flavobacterium aquidurense]MDR7370524.1 putative membrane protein YhhN [Flavobacterium aquidurense]
MRNATIFKTFIVFSTLYLLILLIGYENLDLFLKPILIPLLGFGVYFYRKFPTKNTLLAALLFSWIGDVILLFADIAEIYFILGLVSFLTAHVIYCILFNNQIKTKANKNKVAFGIGSFAIALYLIGMLSLLLPSLGDLKVPVIVYASVISIMLLFVFKGFLVWEDPGNKYIFIGAIVFVISDSILAINKFYTPIERSSFLIMLTYLVAQYLIVVGVLKLNPKKVE